MAQRQIINYKNNNLFVIVGGTRVLSEIIIKLREI